MEGMRESSECFECARAQGYQPAARGCGPAAGRRASRARGWLACLVFAAGGLGAPSGAGELRILMLGDSLTAGYGLASRDALPARLEAALRGRGLDCA